MKAMKDFLLGNDDKDDELQHQQKSLSKMILKRLEDTTDKTIHSDFYMKLLALNEKIDLFKEIFYNKEGFFDKRTQKQKRLIQEQKKRMEKMRQQVEKRFNRKEVEGNTCSYSDGESDADYKEFAVETQVRRRRHGKNQT